MTKLKILIRWSSLNVSRHFVIRYQLLNESVPVTKNKSCFFTSNSLMGLAYYLVLIMAVTNSNLVSCIASH